ncbi:MAG: 7-carboxy-7-deazaguanine synthase [Candidatus Electronema aureum]|uniref:7-carboxy-7-deazaguanine synthase n=1 Tax=Candidatus Electronema aureum TaxID=2005002 RepID=A0A521G272_9BACT|nr:MAG: 7-carboxy-7-deazaguanine synthase [Candidatus Electronema aureum]
MTDTLHISELFYSIQGESTRTGLPCAFVRLCGCNLRCTYCDSSYTWDEEGRRMSVAEVCAWLAQYPGVLVEITGGEPLLHEAVYPLMQELLAQGRAVLLETSGSLSIARVPAAVGVILDIKCPDSGMIEKNDWGNLALLQHRKAVGSTDEIKFVLSSEKDVTWAVQIVREQCLTQLAPVLFSPVMNKLSPARLAAMILPEQLPVRLQLQLHTQIWPRLNRGV